MDSKVSSVRVSKGWVKRLRTLQKKYAFKLKATSFMDEILDVYEEVHCPECGEVIPFNRCSCKDSESTGG